MRFPRAMKHPIIQGYSSLLLTRPPPTKDNTSYIRSDFRCTDIVNYSGTCLIRHTKGPGKCVGLDRMSEYSSFIYVNRTTLGP